MIKSLRKRHLQIWILWAVLLPAGIIVAYMSVPKKVIQELLQAEATRPKKVIASIKKENYDVNILLDSGVVFHGQLVNDRNVVVHDWGFLHLEFINKGLNVPSILLYRIVDPAQKDIDKQELVGRVGGKGAHYFRLPIDTSLLRNIESPRYKGDFIVYDFIKKATIDSLIIKTNP